MMENDILVFVTLKYKNMKNITCTYLYDIILTQDYLCC